MRQLRQSTVAAAIKYNESSSDERDEASDTERSAGNKKRSLPSRSCTRRQPNRGVIADDSDEEIIRSQESGPPSMPESGEGESSLLSSDEETEIMPLRKLYSKKETKPNDDPEEEADPHASRKNPKKILREPSSRSLREKKQGNNTTEVIFPLHIHGLDIDRIYNRML